MTWTSPNSRDRRDHRGGVVFGDGDEQRFFVAEVVEDGTAGQPGLLLQDAHRGTLVAVAREAGPGAAEDLLASGFELVGAHSGHLSIISGARRHRNPYVRLAMPP